MFAGVVYGIPIRIVDADEPYNGGSFDFIALAIIVIAILVLIAASFM
jgi:hypothetical protein